MQPVYQDEIASVLDVWIGHGLPATNNRSHQVNRCVLIARKLPSSNTR
jgi:hypothetical protein